MKKISADQRHPRTTGGDRQSIAWAPPNCTNLGEPSFERLTRFACHLLDVPISFMLLSDGRCFSCEHEHESPPTWTDQVREAVQTSWCSVVMQTGHALLLEDCSRKPLRLPDSSACVAAFIGLPLITSDRQVVGACCALDFHARPWQSLQVQLLRDVADAAIAELEMRWLLGRVQQQAESSERFLYELLDAIPVGIAIADRTGTVLAINRAWRKLAACNAAGQDVHVGDNYLEACDCAAAHHDQGAEVLAEGLRRVLRGEEDCFELKYRSRQPGESRWFVNRVTRFAHAQSTRLLISQEELTRLTAET